MAKLRVEFREVEEFGEELKKVRLQKPLRPIDMARLLHVDAAKYRAWENGKRLPVYAEWKRVRELLLPTEYNSQ